MSRIPKTIFHLEVSDRIYNAKYTGSFKFSDDKTSRKHDERLMEVLIADDVLLNFLYGIVMPVVRFKRREAKRKANEQANQNNHDDENNLLCQTT